MARRLRYFIEYKLIEEAGQPVYLPIGVWVHDPVSDDMDLAYLPEFWEDEFDANQPLNRLIEQGLPFPPDFFDYWNEHIPSHRGQRGEIRWTERFDNVAQAGDWIVERLKAGEAEAIERLSSGNG